MSTDQISMEHIDNVNEAVNLLKKRIIGYFERLQDKENHAYYNYFESSSVSAPEKIKGIAQFPDGKGNYIDIPYNLETPLEVTIKFGHLLFDSLKIRVEFPTVIFGNRNILPQLVFSVKSQVAYTGSYGLVWEALTGDGGKFAFHPITNKLTKKKDLLTYYEDGTVDMFCDVLNRGQYKQISILRKFIHEIIDGKYKKQFVYDSKIIADPNFIQVPIIGEYSERTNEHTFILRCWAWGKNWIPPALLVMNIFYPIASILSMFETDGEFIDGAEPKELEDYKKDKRNLSRKDKAKERKKADNFDPFKAPVSRVQRDEFGYMIDTKKGMGVMDTKAARKSLWEIQKELEEKKKQGGSGEISKAHVQNYTNSTEFFEKNQTKRFNVKGDETKLPFRDKSNITLLKSCRPPFILKFARDQIRVKRGVTSKRAVELIYKVYKLGFLHPA
jgi:hypothetical protein